MNVLFVTIAWPQKGSQNLYSDLMNTFVENGHNVYVVNGSGGQIDYPYEYSMENGIKVLRVKTGNIVKTTPVKKFLSLLTLGIKLTKAINEVFPNTIFQLILFATPPITLSGFFEKQKQKHGAFFYLLLKDIWPYGFADLGVINRGGLAWKYFRWHEKRIYKTADKIGCMSPMGVEFILSHNHNLDQSKVEVCPNSVKVPSTSTHTFNRIREKYKIPKDATVFLFSGNLGKGHGLDFLTNNIISLSDYKKAFFLIGGGGTHFEKLKSALDASNAENFFVYRYLPQTEFEELTSNCDVGLIMLDKSYTYPQFPSRLLAYLKNKMAVLCAINEHTDIGKIIVKNNCGFSLIHGDNKGFQERIKQLCENPGLIEQMGNNGWRLLQKEYDVEVSYQIIMRNIS